MANNHAGFVKRLANSHHAVFVIAEWLGRKYDVRIPVTKVCGEDDDPYDFVDKGDIFISKDGGPERRVEVKGKEFSFSSLDDYRYEHVLTGNKAAVDRIGDDLAAFVLLSQDCKACLIITADTRPEWYLHTRLFRNTGNMETWYACPRHLIQSRQVRGMP